MELAYCGLNCNECPVYLASISKNIEKQIILAKEYSTDTRKFSKDDMFCLGCHSDTLSDKMCEGCEIRKCGIEKTSGSCAACAEFPCSILETYLGVNSDSLNNLKQLAAKYRKTE
ncbi:DUF3795 domain-containing protein [Extibacter muris]|uniref:DUF3795 domain-containing protein n=1 Tax=Extibacter muris TaxID=1796622 RepID=UPI001D06F525|nr:DUF3795 domain-containing protein [Extibacter muris]MCB6202672.1 DUF3795 domain-containing protein [Extibacter muris]MCQ4664532.1 DUF3795 domain-containing protein [Extibacter muris]MCQ4693741.1 DUF3795 domain-containing protein [Extibacter muris]